MNAADVRVGRVVLRGTAHAIDHARATLPAALARAHWPADEAIVVVRRVTVGGTATELPARAVAATEQLSRRATDPWSPGADAAEAVRFRDALDYRACLVRDLLTGTAARRWLWRHRAALLARPAAQALAELLAEDALALPAMLERPALHDSLPALWGTLDAPAAHTLLHAIGTATGWESAVTGALDPTPRDRRADAPLALSAAWIGNPDVGAGRPPSDTRRKALRFSALRSERPSGLSPSDPRVVLQALLALWTQAPATLAGASAGAILRAATTALVRATPAAGQTTIAPRKPHALTADAPASVDGSATEPTETGSPEAPLPSIDTSQRATPPRPTANATSQNSVALESPEGSPSPPATPSRDASVAVSPATPPPAADVDFRTRSGGFFFLLNVLSLPALRDWRATLVEPQAGWRELVRLARSLDFLPDPPLAAFLTTACDLETDHDPATALAALPPGADPVPVHHAALRHYGEAALHAALAERPARVRATRSHVDVHLRLADVHLDIRRTGLDLDPGWLPWLGRVVHFHYDS